MSRTINMLVMFCWAKCFERLVESIFNPNLKGFIDKDDGKMGSSFPWKMSWIILIPFDSIGNKEVPFEQQTLPMRLLITIMLNLLSLVSTSIYLTYHHNLQDLRSYNLIQEASILSGSWALYWVNNRAKTVDSWIIEIAVYFYLR